MAQPLAGAILEGMPDSEKPMNLVLVSENSISGPLRTAVTGTVVPARPVINREGAGRSVVKYRLG